MAKVRYHDRVNELQPLCQQATTPFDRFEWFEALAQRAASPLIAIASQGDGAVGLALQRRNGRIEPLINWYSFFWRPCARSTQDEDEALIWLARGLRRQSHRVTLWPVPEEDGCAERLARAFAKAGWRIHVEPCDVNHILRLNGRNFADYWATRPSQMRNTAKRKRKKLQIEILTDFQSDKWAIYEKIYAQSWKPEEGDPQLLRAFAKAEGRAGRLRLGIARHDGVPVAAQFWTVENGTAYIHKLAHLESHRKFSPGTVLSAALFEHAIDVDRVEQIDFGTGNDGYKADWMEQVRTRYRIDCIDPKQWRGRIALVKKALAKWSPRRAPQTSRDIRPTDNLAPTQPRS